MGWEFLVRLFDEAVPADGHPFQPSLDIRLSLLASQGIVSQAVIDELYAPYRRKYPAMIDSIELGWLPFYDEPHLRKVLATLMSGIAQAAADWDIKRIEERKKPRPAYRRRTPEEVQAIKDQAEKDLRAAGLNPKLSTERD